MAAARARRRSVLILTSQPLRLNTERAEPFAGRASGRNSRHDWLCPALLSGSDAKARTCNQVLGACGLRVWAPHAMHAAAIHTHPSHTRTTLPPFPADSKKRSSGILLRHALIQDYTGIEEDVEVRSVISGLWLGARERGGGGWGRPANSSLAATRLLAPSCERRAWGAQQVIRPSHPKCTPCVPRLSSALLPLV